LRTGEIEAFQELDALGEKAFPAYERILADPQASAHEVTGIFGVLLAVKADRSRFVEPAAKRLTETERGVRWCAVRLLGQIGSRKDSPPIVALLWDEDITIVRAAAEALAVIGGDRELTALDIWLKSGNHRTIVDLRRTVQQCRDALQRKVEEEKKQKQS
jgi:HEAT repeat protein